MANDQGELYILGRDQAESRRLNDQHKLIQMLCHGRLVEPTIPFHELKSVADVATGTGIWLEEMAEELSSQGQPLPRLVGFDISSQQYPAKSASGIELYVQDMMKPFPEKYHNFFDLVHVRLVIWAVPAKEIKALVENLMVILKPGGYLQWDDFNFTEDHEVLFPSERLLDIAEIFHSFARNSGVTLTFANDVTKALRECKLVDVVAKDYYSSAIPGFARASQEWYAAAFTALLPSMFLRSGKAKDHEEANAMMRQRMAEIRDIFASGVTPVMLIVMVTARKPSS